MTPDYNSFANLNLTHSLIFLYTPRARGHDFLNYLFLVAKPFFLYRGRWWRQEKHWKDHNPLHDQIRTGARFGHAGPPNSHVRAGHGRAGGRDWPPCHCHERTETEKNSNYYPKVFARSELRRLGNWWTDHRRYVKPKNAKKIPNCLLFLMLSQKNILAFKKVFKPKVPFTDRCRWQNFRPSLLRLVDRLHSYSQDAKD